MAVSTIQKDPYLAGDRLQYRSNLVATQELAESIVVVDEFLGTHQLPLTAGADLEIRHPLPLLSGPVFDLARPALQIGRGDQTMLCGAEEEEPVAVVLLYQICGGDVKRGRHVCGSEQGLDL